MKKSSLLIVCLCAGLTVVSQAQDTGDVKRTAGGDGPDAANFQRRPRDWDEPIPGPLPSSLPDGWDFGKDGSQDADPLGSKGTIRPGSDPNVAPAGGDGPSLNSGRPSPWERPGPRPGEHAMSTGDAGGSESGGSPLDGLEKGTVRPGTVLPNIKPGGDQTNGGLRPGVDHGPIVWAPSHESGGSSIVPDMADRLPNVNGDGTGAANFQRRPRDWDEPIPGPLPASLPDGWDIGKDGSHDADPLGSKGTIRPGSDPNVAPAGGDGPSLNSGRPSPWDRPGPRPGEHAMSTGDTGGSESGGSPLDDLEKGRLRPSGDSGDNTSLNSARPSPWERPIGPGPRPRAMSTGDTGGNESGGSPLDDLEKGRLRPSGGSGDAVRAPQQGSSGSPMVADMVDHLLGGFKDVPDVNGDGKIDIADVTTLIDLLLEEE